MVWPGTHVCCSPGRPLGSCCPPGPCSSPHRTPPPPPAELHRSRSQDNRALGAEGNVVSPAAAGVQRSQHRGWGSPPGHRRLCSTRITTAAAVPGEGSRPQHDPSVTHLRLALGAPPLPPGPAPLARTALLPSQSEIRVQAWLGHSLFEGKTGIRGKARRCLRAHHSLLHAQTPVPAQQKLVSKRSSTSVAHGELGMHRNQQGDLRGYGSTLWVI